MAIKMDRQQWLEAVVNDLGKALWTTDRAGNITFMNESARKLAGCTDNEFIGLPLDEVYPLFSAATHRRLAYPVQKALERGNIYHSEQSAYLRLRDGRTPFAVYTISPLRGPNEEFSGAIVVMCTFVQDPAPKQFSSASFPEVVPEGPATRQAVYTKKEGQFVRVLLEDIRWVEAMENYVQLVTQRDRFVVHTTMKKLAARLEGQGFVRVHRSYIVSIDRVDAIEENRIYVGKNVIPIGKAYRKTLMQALTFI
ncbi:MAG: LytTR family transcriptional regulator DNA-binding domain-containing protein [Bacteroidota bacterium]